jgi:two-component system sensor histidine kinase UhpB
MHIQRHVRDILRQLRPVTQLEFGLEAAMGDLAAFWGRRNPKIRFALDISLPVTPGRRQEEAAYRLVQEAVSNAVRHGQPDRIEIVLRADDGGLTILVEDNGGGFKGVNRDSMSLGKAGIAGMRERVLALGGALDITNLAGRGVRVSATIPLSLAHEPA